MNKMSVTETKYGDFEGYNHSVYVASGFHLISVADWNATPTQPHRPIILSARERQRFNWMLLEP